MSLIMQIIWGTVVLSVCSLIHLMILVWAFRLLGRLGNYTRQHHYSFRWGSMFGLAFGSVVFAHTVQVWVWAGSFVYMGVLPELADAIYFALVTYTTVGYGDVTVGVGYRVFAAMASVTGLLNFGLSTAFLVGLFAKMLPEQKM